MKYEQGGGRRSDSSFLPLSFKSMINSLSFRRRKQFAVCVLLLFPLASFVCFYVFPLGYTVNLSFHEWDGISPSMKFVGLKNYTRVFGDRYFPLVLKNTALWLIFYLTVPPFVGLVLALALNSKCVRLKTVFETIFFIPYTITPIAVAAIWKWMYIPGHGVINAVLRRLGFMGANWLGDPHIINYSIMLAALWWTTGYAVLLYSAGLKLVPVSIIEAAKIDGANFPQTVRYVIIPLLRPTTIVVIAMMGLTAIKMFDLVFAMTGGEPGFSSSPLAVYMYRVTFLKLQMGEGAVVTLILVILALSVIVPYLIYSIRQLKEVSQ